MKSSSLVIGIALFAVGVFFLVISVVGGCTPFLGMGPQILITADQCQMMAVQQFLIFSPIAASFTVAALAIFYIGRNKVPGELVKTGTSTS